MTAQSQTSIRAQVTIMILTTIVEFACAFGCMALLALGWFEASDGTLEPRLAVALTLSFGLSLWTGFGAMMLVCRPTPGGFFGVLMRALVAIAPMLFLWL